MAKKHGARQQKKVAKQKAKRAEKRTTLARRDSTDPAIRLKKVENWPVVEALVSKNLWDDGMGYLLIARQEAEGRLVFAVYLVDAYCLGVKDAFWRAGTSHDFKDLVRKIEERQPLRKIAPEALAKIVKGAVDYAASFDFPPHPDYRHAGKLLAGIDPTACPDEFSFGKDGKPYYTQGPDESFVVAQAIAERVRAAGGHSIVRLDDPFDDDEFDDDEFDDDEFDEGRPRLEKPDDPDGF